MSLVLAGLCAAITALSGFSAFVFKHMLAEASKAAENDRRKTDLLEKSLDSLERERSSRDEDSKAFREYIGRASRQLDMIWEKVNR